MKVKLDRRGIVALLQGPFGQKAVSAAATDIAGRVSATAHDGPVPVVVEAPHAGEYAAVAAVVLDHPGGFAIEAKHGPLAKAAAAGGYTLKG